VSNAHPVLGARRRSSASTVGSALARLQRKGLAARLALLEAPMQLTAWCDSGIVERFLCLRRDVDGGGSNDYLRRMQVSKQSDPHARHQAFGKDLRLLVTLSASVYTLTR